MIDIFTGWSAKFHGVVLAALEADEVDRMVDVLNVGDLAQRGQLRQLRLCPDCIIDNEAKSPIGRAVLDRRHRAEIGSLTN